jgi:hypothetical protein
MLRAVRGPGVELRVAAARLLALLAPRPLSANVIRIKAKKGAIR